MTVAVNTDDDVEDLVDEGHRGHVRTLQETSALVDALREATGGATVGKHDVSTSCEERVVFGRREPCVTRRLPSMHAPTFSLPSTSMPKNVLRSRDASFHL